MSAEQAQGSPVANPETAGGQGVCLVSYDHQLCPALNQHVASS